MSKHISWHAELAVDPARLAEFCALTDEMVRSTEAEPGALVYDRYISEDRRIVHVVERYADSAAALAHLQAFASMYGERFSSLIERRRFTVFGTPSPALKAMLDRFGAVYCPRLAGFARC